jgi:hypothetical protein
MVEGIDNKEPDSPRIADGEFLEEECKFLPPPKTVADPRLWHVSQGKVTEYSNQAQIKYLLRTNELDPTVTKTHAQVSINTLDKTSHLFVTPSPAQYKLLSDSPPLIPQALELVNQTCTIASEPPVTTWLTKNVIEHRPATESDVASVKRAF